MNTREGEENMSPPPNPMETKHITTQQFVELIKSARGAMICTITSLTEVKNLKAASRAVLGTPVYKMSIVNGVVNFNYERSVNSQREREGEVADFVAEETWGEHVPGYPMFVRHTPARTNELRHYLVLKVEKTGPPTYLKADLVTEIPTDEIRPWFYEKGESRQNLIKEVIYRRYDLRSITGFIWGGKKYEISYHVGSPIII